jgi:tetratricopeptide (TPR) repeat protein
MNGAVLIVVDDASSEAQVRPLLPGAGPHRTLVTSRHTLAGLPARLLDIKVLSEQAGVELLDKALRAARPADRRISDCPAAAGRLARACGGLPLALQIVAALLKADPGLSAAEMASDMECEHQRLELLRYDDGGPALWSVEAAFEMSYRRLDARSARLLRLLSLVPGPDASTMSAAVICDTPFRRVRGLLAGLAQAHLVEEASAGAGRWRMHDLVRLYARQRSVENADPDNADGSLDRLLGYFLGMADAADTHLRALPGEPVPSMIAGRDQALAWLDAERPGLITAVSAAARSGRDQVTMELPLALAVYLDLRRRFDDLVTICMLSVAAARRLGHLANEAAALTAIGNALRQLRRFGEAIAAHQKAIAIYRATSDRTGEADSLANLGNAMAETRRFGEAIAAHRDAILIFRETSNRQGEAVALTGLGNAMVEARQFSDAISTYREALVIYQETGDRQGEGVALTGLGNALASEDRFGEAIAAHVDAIAIYQEAGDRHGKATALSNLGSALSHVRRFGEAIAAYQDAIAIFGETGDENGKGMALTGVGLALDGADSPGDAITAYRGAIGVFQGLANRYGEGMALNNLGGTLARMQRLDDATAAYEAAFAIFGDAGEQHGQGTAVQNLDSIRQAQRPGEETTAYHRAAISQQSCGRPVKPGPGHVENQVSG